MSKERMGSCRERNAVAQGRESNERLPTSEEQDEQLLPGIPNEITLEHISTKLPWGALCILSSVCRAWKQAIQSRRVFEARVRSNSTETLVVHSHRCHNYSEGCTDRCRFADHSRISLYSMKGYCCYELPPIPQFLTVMTDTEFISLEGTLYAVGRGNSRKEVYALDLVGQRKWKQCASMQHGGVGFTCGVIGGKIYVFGGSRIFDRVDHTEVYDPKVNAWSPVKSRRPPCCFDDVNLLGEELYYGDVAPLGEELLVFSGVAPRTESDTAPKDQDEALYLEAYHPTRDEWRTVHPFGRALSGRVFMSEGKFYLISQRGIYVHNSDDNSWRDLHSNSFPVSDLCKVDPHSIVAIQDELLMGASWRRGNGWQDGLFRSKGFGSQIKEIVWEDATCSRTYEGCMLCAIEL